MRVLVLLLFSLAQAFGQDIGRTLCALEWPAMTVAPPGTNTSSRVGMYVPSRITINGKTVVGAYPICAELGPGLKLAVVNGRWELSAQALRMAVERFTIVENLIQGNTYKFDLQKMPAPNTALLVFASGSNVGSNVAEATLADSRSKQVVITVAPQRPIESPNLTVVYWHEPP